jgi:diguanylate cyclase (GGDEF)-like protein
MGRILFGRTYPPDENARIVAFLRTLTGNQPRLELPILPPSTGRRRGRCRSGKIRRTSRMEKWAEGVLAGTPLFQQVPVRTRTVLLSRAVTRRLPNGGRLLTAGQRNTSLFIIVEGAVDVHLPRHGPHVRLRPGDCVGELSLIDGQPVSADVVAAAGTTVLEVPHAHVWTAIDTSAVFARNLLRVLAGRVRHDDVALVESSDRRRHYERLSMLDGLTALHNRRWLDVVFPAHLERLVREERAAALLMIDVDRFKAINDGFGHAAGDAVLRRVAIALTEGLRPEDLLARYGGEEFAVLVADVHLCEAMEVADRLRRAVAALDLLPGLSCTVSVGVAVASPGEPFAALVPRADAALFRAKQAGRNRVSA